MRTYYGYRLQQQGRPGAGRPAGLVRLQQQGRPAALWGDEQEGGAP